MGKSFPFIERSWINVSIKSTNHYYCVIVIISLKTIRSILMSKISNIKTQKGRDAKVTILTSSARNTVLKTIKKAGNKARRLQSKEDIRYYDSHYA